VSSSFLFLDISIHFHLHNLSRIVMLLLGPVGNSCRYSCSVSPAASRYILSVAHTIPPMNLLHTHSNFGNCIDIQAPGYQLRSPWPHKLTAIEQQSFRPMSGSSAGMAVVTGVAVLLLSSLQPTPPSRAPFSLSALLEALHPDDDALFLRSVLVRQHLEQHSIVETVDPHSPSAYVECKWLSTHTITEAIESFWRNMVDISDRPVVFQRVKRSLNLLLKQNNEAKYLEGEMNDA
jgi:hypothetical protein